MSLVFRLRGKSESFGVKKGKRCIFFQRVGGWQPTLTTIDENMNNDYSLIEQMRVVVVFARSAPGKALNTLSCEAIIVVRFGGHFSPRTGT